MSVRVRRRLFKESTATGNMATGNVRCRISATKRFRGEWGYRVVIIDQIGVVESNARHVVDGDFPTALIGMENNEKARQFISLLEEVRGAVREKVRPAGYFTQTELSCVAHLVGGAKSIEELSSLIGEDREVIYQAVARLHGTGIVQKDYDDFRINDDSRMMELLRADREFRKILKDVS